MNTGAETASASAPRRRPTVLALRRVIEADARAALAKAIEHHGQPLNVEWPEGADSAALSAFIEERLGDRDIVLFAEGALAEVALGVDAPPVRRIVAIDPPAGAMAPARRADIVLRDLEVVSPALVAAPGVRLHRASPGVTLYAEEVRLLIAEVLREACRRAVPERPVVDEPLLEATPLVAGTLGYLGPEGEAFVEAYVARRPGAEGVVLSEPSSPRALDVLALGAPLPAQALAQVLTHLKPGGWLVARWVPADAVTADLLAVMEAAGLRMAAPIDHGGTGVFRARRADTPPPTPMLVTCSAISPMMMDIRTRLPVQQMASDPDLAVRYLVPLRNVPPAPLDQPKVAVMQRPARTDAASWRNIVSRFIAKGWVCVIEFDDHPLLVAEVAGLPQTEEQLLRFGWVHGVQTSVEPLADLFRRYNPEVAVFPNAVFDLRPFAESAGQRRVFYGATPRGELPAAVARSLAPVVERFPDVEFVVVGSQAVFDALPTARKSLHPYLSYEAYLDVMATCAVSLTPIDALPMFDTKSDAKFLDASRAGVLTIASPTIYARTIRHGETGLIAETLADWPRLLTQALADPEDARRMARNAWDEVRGKRMFVDQIPARKAWYRQLWDRRDELSEAVMERLPGLREEVASLRGD